MSAAMVPLAVLRPKVRLVSDDQYLPVLRSLIANATWRCLCSLFLADLSPAGDRELLVDSVLLELQEARWRGVDARLLIGGSRSNFEIAELSELARARALQIGLPCRWLTSKKVRGSHTKVVVADDAVLTGSHNWSVGAFTDQSQDSLLVESADLAAYSAALFRRQWKRAQ